MAKYAQFVGKQNLRVQDQPFEHQVKRQWKPNIQKIKVLFEGTPRRQHLHPLP